MKIKIELTMEEVNGVLTALSHMPFNQVAALIQNVTEQAQTQLQNDQAPLEVEKEM